MANSDYELIKKYENSIIYEIEKGKVTTNIEFHLAPHYDGKVNMAIGYGLDLKVNGWQTIQQYLTETNNLADEKFNLDYKHEVSENLSYTFEEIVKKYQTDFNGLSEEAKGVARVVLDTMRKNINYKKFPEDNDKEIIYNGKIYSKKENTSVYTAVKNFCENVIVPLAHFSLPNGKYAGQLLEVMAPKYRQQAKNKLKAGDYDKLPYDCQRGALLSLAYNTPELIGKITKTHISRYVTATDEIEKLKSRLLVWVEIRYRNNGGSSRGQGIANRRYLESDYWGLVGENETLDKVSEKQLAEIGKMDLENKLMLKHFLNTVKPTNSQQTIRAMAEAYEKKFPTTYQKEKKSFTFAELLKAVDVQTVQVILKQIEAAGKKIDTVAKAFLEKYDGQKTYCIDPDRNGVIRKSVTQIIEKSDVTVFNLMQKLVLETKKGAEQGSDQLKLAVDDFIKKCKTNLEEVIKEQSDYKRPSYVEDNQDFPEELNSDRAKNLVTAFGERFPVQTPKCRAFFKSFITEEEEENQAEPTVEREDTEVDNEAEQSKAALLEDIARMSAAKRDQSGQIIWYDQSVGSFVITSRDEYYKNKRGVI